MISLCKTFSTKPEPTPAAENKQAPARPVPVPEELFWSPYTAGPYLVPVSRWIE